MKKHLIAARRMFAASLADCRRAVLLSSGRARWTAALAAALLLNAASAGSLQAIVLAHWEADDTPGPGGANSANVTWTAPNITASAVGISSGSNTIQGVTGSPTGSSISGDPVFRTSGWHDATPTKFYDFSIDVTGANLFGPNTLNLDEVRFYTAHSTTNRQVNLRLDWSTDGVSFTPGTEHLFQVTTNTWAEFGQPINLFDLTDPVFFRLYLWSDTLNSASTISIDDIRIFGQVLETPEPIIPEPSTLALVILGVLGVTCRRPKRAART